MGYEACRRKKKWNPVGFKQYNSLSIDAFLRKSCSFEVVGSNLSTRSISFILVKYGIEISSL
jgi:hypothetical protein